MRHRGVGIVAAAALLSAGPALAEKAYIPVSEGAAGRGTHRTEISITNARGAALQSVSARLGYEAGGVGAAQTLAIRGGETKRLAGLAGNGLLELDLAPGVEAKATLVVERAGGKSVRAYVPTLTAADSMPAGSRALLLGAQLAEDFKKTSVGVVNLSGRAMTCSASFEDGEGASLFAPIGFSVAPRAERRSGSFAGSKGRVDVHSLAAVQCDAPFWAYAVAEQASTGAVKVVLPAKEVALRAQTTEAGTKVFTLPGTFLVPKTGNWSYHFNMYFGATTTFQKVVTDLDVYIAGWDPKKQDGIHLVLWLQRDGWSTMMQYMNVMKKGVNKFRWNYYPNYGFQKSPGMKVGNTYHVHTEWDGFLKKNGYVITKAGVFYTGGSGPLGTRTFTGGKVFAEFAHPNNGPEGPESRTPGWKYSNFRAEFFPPLL